MMSRLISKWIFVTAVLLLPSTVFAAYVDFTSSEFSGVDGVSTSGPIALDDGTNVTLDAVQPVGALLSQSSEGIGIDSLPFFDYDNPNQIDNFEIMTVQFDQDLTINRIDIGGFEWCSDSGEVGYYEIADSEGVVVGGGALIKGQSSINVSNVIASTITFGGNDGWFASFSTNDFTVRGIDYGISGGSQVGVPELDANLAGSSLALMIGVALVFNGRRRRLT